MIKLDATTSLNRRKSFTILAVIHKPRIEKAAAKEHNLAQDKLLSVLILMTFDRSVLMHSLFSACGISCIVFDIMYFFHCKEGLFCLYIFIYIYNEIHNLFL